MLGLKIGATIPTTNELNKLARTLNGNDKIEKMVMNPKDYEKWCKYMNDPTIKMAFDALTKKNDPSKYFHPNKKIQRFIRQEMEQPHIKKLLAENLAKIIADEQRKFWFGFIEKDDNEKK